MRALQLITRALTGKSRKAAQPVSPASARCDGGGLPSSLAAAIRTKGKRSAYWPISDARIIIEDGLALLPPSARAPVLAQALTKDMSTEEAEAVANEIGREIHLIGRGELPSIIRQKAGF